jgi:hypothetical protein
MPEDVNITVSGPSTGPRRTLPALLAELLAARANLLGTRLDAQAGSITVATARWRLHRALQAYAHALNLSGLPVPYALRDELRLHQHLPSRR